MLPAVWMLLWRLQFSGRLMKQHWAAGVILEATKHHTTTKKEKKRLHLSASI